MPVPKRKTSKSRRDKRQANKGIKPKAFTFCSNCSEPTMPHQVCMTCGFYKGVKVIATKLDRGLKRRQDRQALAQKQAARQGQGQEGQAAGSESPQQ